MANGKTQTEKYYIECEIYGELGCSHWASEKCECDCHKVSGWKALNK